MCLGIPCEVVALLEGDLATVSVSGVEREVSIGLLVDEGIKVGDWVLVHVGFALSKIDAEEADQTLDQIKKLGQVWDDELDAFKQTEIR
ncbi:MAG: HypC/HybG/HupF family hydrogenase formation chaperone [Propionibacteriaceae bacterium]|jgi:hydrogenase expression/formation protein HypC|nr:HypC/HybG/HupF family hydrogenase formation chaperone [Propionibacteriaceae bacterium]